MSRFKRSKNKSNKKSSISINEKISLLNKELKKTGMISEVLDTSNVYSTSTHVPPLERIEGDVPNSSGIGAEGFSQNSSGSGNEGEPPSFSNLSDLFNSSVNSTIFKSTSFGGNQGYGIVIGPSFGAGTTYGIIEGGNIYRAVLGGFLAGGTRGPGNYEAIYNSYLEVNERSPGFYSQEQIDNAFENWKLAEQVHAALVEIGFDNSKFNIPWQAWRSPRLFEDNEGVPSFAHPTKGTLFLHGFSLLGSVNRYLVQNSQPRTTTNPIIRGFENDPIYPGPIPPGMFPPMSEAGYNELRRRAEAERKRQEEEERRRREEEERENQEEEDGPLVYGMTQEEVEAKFGHLSDEELKEQGIIRNPDGSYREMTAAEKREYKELKDWQESMMRRFRGIFKDMNDSQLENHLKKVGLWDKVFSIPKPNKFMERSIDNAMAAAGRALRLKSASNMLSKYDDWLRKGAPGSVDVTNQIQQSSMNRLVKSINSSEVKSAIQKAIATAKGSDANNPVTPLKGLDKNWNNVRTKADAHWAAAADKVTKKLQKAVHSNLDLDNTLHNNVQIDRKLFRDSGGKKIVIVKTYQFRPGGSVKKAEGTLLGKFMTRAGIKLDTFGTGVTGWMGVAAASMGLRGAMMYGGSYSAPGMPMRITVQAGAGEKPTPSPLDVKRFKTGSLMFNYEPQGDVLSEGVGLGLYEPEAMNVDLADIRKGVMPEYPKKPPAKMIDGYHQDSKLRPKEFKDKYLLKIDKNDLIRNHRLKKSEVDEMVNTIKMINDYLKKHPEDLIYVQQRYPVDDKRLAELNWKMDQMLQAGEEYIDSNFKENQTLYKRAMDRTKKNIKLTNPEYVQQHYDELRGTIKSKPRINRKSPSRFFKKPVRKKSSMDEINDKIKQLDKDLLI